MEQGTDAWLRVRGGKITGSRFARAMSSKKATCEGLIEQLVKERRIGRSLDSVYVSPAMQWGIDHEPHARRWYSAKSGCSVQQVAFVRHREIEFVGVSPDGLVNHAGLIEIKCPQLKGFRQVVDCRRVPTRYYWQIQGGLWVCDRDWADFICFYPPGQGVIVRVDKDEGDWKRLEHRCLEINRDVEKRLRFRGTSPSRPHEVVRSDADAREMLLKRIAELAEQDVPGKEKLPSPRIEPSRKWHAPWWGWCLLVGVFAAFLHWF